MLNHFHVPSQRRFAAKALHAVALSVLTGCAGAEAEGDFTTGGGASAQGGGGAAGSGGFGIGSASGNGGVSATRGGGSSSSNGGSASSSNGGGGAALPGGGATQIGAGGSVTSLQGGSSSGQPGSGGKSDGSTGGQPSGGAVGRGGGSNSGGQPSGGAAAEGTPSPGCGRAPERTGVIAKTVQVNGVARTYDLYVPPGTNGSDPLPLVFVFHHSGGTSAAAAAYGIQDAASAAGDKAIFVFPQALLTSDGVGWELGCTRSDMQLTDAIYDATLADQCIETGNVLASGFSWGADMTIAFGCCRSDRVRAIAPSSGTAWGSWKTGCAGKTPAFRITIGTPDSYYSLSAVQGVTDFFRTQHGCGTATTASEPTAFCKSYGGCAKPVIQCVYEGIGHSIPDQGARYIWDFLRAF